MKKYRKKPVVVEAEQFFFVGNPAPLHPAVKQRMDKTEFGAAVITSYIETLEGDMIISEGDWIIKGVEGEFYPCKPKIFEKTYEEAQ